MVYPASPVGHQLPPPLPGPPIPAERPDTPFVLSVLGGVFIALAGAVEIYDGAVAPFAPFGNGGVDYVLFGTLGCGLGVLIIILGSLLLSRPERRSEIGILITVLSVISVVSFFGGFVIGLVLGVLGGVFAIAWRPRPFAPAWPGAGWQVPAHRVCLHCGRFLSFDMRVCPYCATPVG
ncbi:MAG: DUF6114 domain-containing protein [Thermoplasmata archaeon]|nr:DUF6114 domain-containing protein [Thermoplasmata archaeon]